MRVRQYLLEQALLKAGDRVVVGVSGGPDSLCLLDLLHSLAASWNLTLHVAHLNHGLRPEAAAEADFVRAEAEGRGLPFHTENADTRAHARAHKCSIEEAARELRYAFLARAALSVGAPLIAVAHTADDQAETVLMRFLRGAGVSGLRGMPPQTVVSNWGLVTSNYQFPITLIRPLLTTTRAEVETYCAERGLRPVQDATNLDTIYFRNRLRHELLPLLESYNPNVRDVLRRTAEVMAGADEILRGVTERLWSEAARQDGDNIFFDKARWLMLSAPEQWALLREAMRRLRSGLRNVDFTPLDRAVRFSRTAQAGRSCDLLGGLRLSVSAAQITIHPWNARPATPSVPLLDAGGQLASGWEFRAETLGPGEWSPEAMALDSSAQRVYIDAARVQAPLRLRFRRPGERFCPLGLGGHSVKLSDFMINVKMDKDLRDRWPIIVSGEAIVWIAGHRLDERFKVTPATQTIMRLWFVRESEAPEIE